MKHYIPQTQEDFKAEVADLTAENVEPSLEDAQEFLKLLDPDATEFNFQVFFPREMKRPDRERLAYRFGLAPVQWSVLMQKNFEGGTVAVAVQAMNGEKRSNDEAAYARAVFADFDDAGEPDWDAFPIEPSIIVQSSQNRWHVYWLCTRDMPLTDFDQVQQAIIKAYPVDKVCKERARAMRIPGSLNLKQPDKPFLVRMTGGNHQRYTGAQLRAAFVGGGADSRERTIVLDPTSKKSTVGTVDREDSTEDLLAKYRDALFSIRDCTSPAFGYHEWSMCGMALKSDCGDTDDAFALFDEWSREKDPDRYGSEAECRRAWDAFRCDHASPVRFGSVVKLIRQRQPSFDPLLTRTGSTGKKSTWVEWPDCDKKGKPQTSSIKNVRHFLASEDVSLRYNEFTGEAEITKGEGKPESLPDAAALDIWRDMRDRGCAVGLPFLKDALLAIALEARCHPVREELRALTWDGIPRVDGFFVNYAGVDDTALHRAYGRAWLIATVRRVMKPGCELYGVPVLEDPEGGKGKSTLFKALATPPLFTDCVSLGDTPKEVLEVAHGKWILEVSELGGLRTRDWDLIKAMITRTEDRARKAFNRYTSSDARQFVIAATTNQTEYLQESGGLRRFWTMKVTGKIDVEGVRRDRDQILAEAVMLEATGEHHNIPEALWEKAAKSRQLRVTVSTFEALFGDELDASPDGFLHRSEIIGAIQTRGLDIHRTKFTDADMARHGFEPVQLRKGEHRGKRGFQKGDETGWLTYSSSEGFALGDKRRTVMPFRRRGLL